MKRVILIVVFILQIFLITKMYAQSFTIKEVTNLCLLPAGDIGNVLFKNGFTLNSGKNAVLTSYIQRIKTRKTESVKTIDYYEQEGSKYFVFKIQSFEEFVNNRKSLIKAGFFYDPQININTDSFMLFQKANITIGSVTKEDDGIIQYTFTVEKKKAPDSVNYAEDLLQFDSHEFLVSYFGEKNVSSDLYYLSEKELKKCSVLFGGTRYQAVFVWGDQNNLNHLSYILVSNVLPTKEGKEKGFVDGNNIWKFHNGIQWGMQLRDMLRLNEMDFYLYGNKSDLAFMVKPELTGKIDFRKTAIMLSCKDCSKNEIFDQREVSALDVAKANLPLQIFDIILYP